MKSFYLIIYFLFYLFCFQFCFGLPLMGFSTWNAFKRDYNESILRENVDLMVSMGFVKLGYDHFNIDGEWWEAGNNNKVRRIEKRITESNEKFPSSMKSFSEYVHKNGMKLGLYTSASTRSCFDKDTPMSYGFEVYDSKKFVDWDIDFIKIDSCGLKINLFFKTLKKWRNLLPLNIIISNCRLGCYNDKNRQKWCSRRSDLYSMYRTSIDIKPTFDSIIHNIESITRFPFNPNVTKDPDFLELGNGLLTFEEQKSHIALWSITSSPLIISTDLRKINEKIINLLKNKLIININQSNEEYSFKIMNDKIIIEKKIKNENYLLVVNKSNKQIEYLLDNSVIRRSVFDLSIVKNEIKLIGPHDCLFVFS